MYRCADGPLKGEMHEQGTKFFFNGRPLGFESGFYELSDGVYCWRPADYPPADEKPQRISLDCDW
jgi:hypothetical protein